MAVMDPSFVGPEAYDNFDSLRIRLKLETKKFTMKVNY